MTTQPDLFYKASHVSRSNDSTTVDPQPKIKDICYNYHKGNPMSVAANKIAHKHKVSARYRIMDELKFHKQLFNEGRTCEELENETGLSHQTCSARLSELRRDGKIKIVGQRQTRSGSPAAVYQTI